MRYVLVAGTPVVEGVMPSQPFRRWSRAAR